MKAAEHPARLMSEVDLQKSVEDLLTLYGWRWHHETDSRKSRAGFPDLIAVHPSGRFLLIELKGYDARGRLGKVTDEQLEWIGAWNQAARHAIGEPHGQICAYIWGPMDWHSGVIARTLRVR